MTSHIQALGVETLHLRPLFTDSSSAPGGMPPGAGLSRLFELLANKGEAAPRVLLAQGGRASIQAAIEDLICLLDEADGDADLEGEEDCCAAFDDYGGKSVPSSFGCMGLAVGDPQDAEEDDPPEDNDDREADRAEIGEEDGSFSPGGGVVGMFSCLRFGGSTWAR